MTIILMDIIVGHAETVKIQISSQISLWRQLFLMAQKLQCKDLSDSITFNLLNFVIPTKP
jgi:hypothetical protein